MAPEFKMMYANYLFGVEDPGLKPKPILSKEDEEEARR